MYEENRRDSGEQLSFNMAKDYTYRIAEYLHEFETLWAAGLLKPATWSLKKVWHMLTPYLSDDEDNELDNAFNEIQRMFIQSGVRSKLNSKLESLNRNIRKKLKARGLLIPVSSDPRFMFKKK